MVADVGECAVAVVVEEVVFFAAEASGAAHDLDAAEGAAGVADGFGAGDGGIFEVEVDVAGDEEVEVAVAVVVSEGGSGGPGAEGDFGGFSNVSECAVVVVAIEAVFAVVGDVEVGPAVVVEVADDDAVAPAVVGDPGFFSDVGEGAVVVVVEEGGFWCGLFAVEGIEGGAVDEVDVEPAVVVVIEEGDARALCFEDEFLFGGSGVVTPGGEAGLFGNVLEDDGAGFDEAAGGDGAMLGVVLTGLEPTGETSKSKAQNSGNNQSPTLKIRSINDVRRASVLPPT